jgi:hypothetical protein
MNPLCCGSSRPSRRQFLASLAALGVGTWTMFPSGALAQPPLCL